MQESGNGSFYNCCQEREAYLPTFHGIRQTGWAILGSLADSDLCR